MKRLLLATACLLAANLQAQTNYDLASMKRETLNRGVVAVRQDADTVVISWRYLESDPMDQQFQVYRNNRLLATVGSGMSTTYRDCNPSAEEAVYEVVAVGQKKKKQESRGTWTLPANAPVGYVDIPLQRPADVDDVYGRYSYSANDASMADLDGDGEMEIVLKWDPSNSKDNSQSGITGHQLLDAYKLDGTMMWRIDLGRNIRSGAHYTQFMVYDLDGDGKAEVVAKTSDGTVDGKGRVIGDPDADYRVGMAQKSDTAYNAQGHRGEQFRQDQKGRRGGFIDRGNEYLTCFSGRTGEAISTVDYLPGRGTLQSWGDNYANRSDRYLACVAYLDGKHASVVMCRGYYTRTTLAAFDFDGKKLRQRWFFDSDKVGRDYHGQGNHNLRVGDVDGDGRDEIIYGSCAIDDDGSPLYSTRMGHGDAMHLTAFRPLDDHLYVWDCHENKRDGSELHDAATGKIIFQRMAPGDDVGRCMAADVIAENPGLEVWSSRSDGIRSITGEVLDSMARIPVNFGVWWDGDLLREMLDHETVSKYNRQVSMCMPLLKMEGCRFNNGTKSNPCLTADILGDWREEVLTRTEDSRHLRLYVSTMPTSYRFHTFLQDPVYRHSVTTQNVAYNQPTQVGFYFGAELEGSGQTFRGWEFK